MSIQFHVSKPSDPQYKPIHVVLEVKDNRWILRYSRREGDVTELSEDEEGDREAVYLKAVKKCLDHFSGSHRPLILYTDNVYLKNCLNEWIDKLIKSETSPYLDILNEIESLKKSVKLENVVLEPNIEGKIKTS